MVSRIAPLPGSGITVCTDPLPKLPVPRRIARRWSCSAPDTISDAEADPPLISTDERRALQDVVTLGIPALAVLRMARAGGDDLPLVDEIRGHRDRLVQQAAGIVAQIEHQAAQLAAVLLPSGP